VEPSLAGPKLPQQRIPLSRSKEAFYDTLEGLEPGAKAEGEDDPVERWASNGGAGGGTAVAAATASAVRVRLSGEDTPDGEPAAAHDKPEKDG